MINNFHINPSINRNQPNSLTHIVTARGNNKVGLCMTRDYQLIDHIFLGNIVLPYNSEYESRIVNDQYRTSLMICIRTPDISLLNKEAKDSGRTFAHHVIDVLDSVTTDIVDREVIMAKIKDSTDVLTIISLPPTESRDVRYPVIKSLIAMLNALTITTP